MSLIEKKSLTIPFSFDEVKGIFTGYASVFNEVDRVKDTVASGAYDITIQEWKDGKTISINFEHDKKVILADNIDEMSPDEKGLLIKWTFSEKAKLLYPDIFAWAVEKAKTGKLFMSIGFKAIDSTLGESRAKFKGKYLQPDTLKVIDLDHVAITDNPVDTKAQIMEVKGLRTPKFPVALIMSWDGSAANKRWREYTGSTDKPTASYKDGFLYVEDEREELFGSYHFQVVDIIDGKPMINERAVITAHAYLKGARLGVKILSTSQKLQALQIISDLYGKINEARKEAGQDPLPEVEIKTEVMSINDSISLIDGKVTAKRFIKINKDSLSNTNVENLVDHLFKIFSRSEKKKELEASVIEPQRNEIKTSVDEGQNNYDILFKDVAKILTKNK